MRRLMILLLVCLLLPMALAVVPAAHAQAAPAGTHATARQATSAIVGNWYRGKMWFRVRGPWAGRYKVAWSNGSGPMIKYTIKKLSVDLYYETANHRNTYRVLSGGQKVRVHYQTTGGGYVTRTFLRIE